MKTTLTYDYTDCLNNATCLVGNAIDSDTQQALARLNPYQLRPSFDSDLQTIVGPSIPAPFINPPMVLRSWALLTHDKQSPFSVQYRYREGTHMGSLVSLRPLQWVAAAGTALSMANLVATISGPLGFQRKPLKLMIDLLAPKPGEGPSESALSNSGYRLDVFATAENGERWQGHIIAEGHPGYRSTPNLIVEAAIALAQPGKPLTKHYGVITAATGLGLAFIPLLEHAGLQFVEGVFQGG